MAVEFPLDPLTQFIAQVIAIVLVARILGRVARLVGQPMVVAEILAGILLGPSLLGWLLPDVSAALFAPQSLVSLKVVSSIGLVLFMFLIGLELDPGLLRGRGQASLVISQTSFLVPLGLGVALGLHLFPRVAAPEVSLAVFSLFIAVVMSNTAFPVLARILSERRLLRSRVGAITITCAAIDDVLAWCLLAFAVAWARANGVAEAGRTTLLATLYIAFMFWAVRPLLHRLAARVASGGLLTQNLVAAIMLLLLASSCATELIGIHAVFGAFLLGAILPRDGGFAHALAEKLEDLVIVVLLPLFFAYSGLRTEVGLLDSTASWVTCGLIVLVACVGKFGASALAARFTGMTWRESVALGALMNTRGLMVLIVLNIGLDLGIISPKLFAMMVMMALVTTFMTTPILDAVYPPHQHVKDLLAASESARESHPEPGRAPFTMLLCVADEQSGRGLLKLSRALGGGHGDARVHALHLLGPSDEASVGRPKMDRVTEDAAEILPPWLPRGLEADTNIKPMSFVSSDPAQEICQVADVKAADLVVLARDPPRGGPFFGRTIEQVTRQARSDVAIFFEGGGETIRRVLLSVAETANDRASLQLAERLLEAGAEVDVLRPRPPLDRPTLVDEFVEEPRHRHVRVRPMRLEEGLAEGCDLLVVTLASGESSYHRTLRAWLEHRDRGVSLLVVRGRPDLADHTPIEPQEHE